MQNIELKALGISVPSEDTIKYYDDGFVDSIANHVYKLRKWYGYNFITRYKEYVSDLLSDVVGQSFYIYKNGFDNFHIYYLEQNQVINSLVRGHEETHFLDHFKGLSYLEQKILNELKIKISFDEIDNKEVKAYIGGIYSVIMSGTTIENMHYRNRLLDKAKNIFKRAKKEIDGKIF